MNAQAQNGQSERGARGQSGASILNVSSSPWCEHTDSQRTEYLTTHIYLKRNRDENIFLVEPHRER